MKKIFYILIFTGLTITIFSQQMVVQKNDGSNLFIDLNTISLINFIIPCPETPTVDYGGKTYNTVLVVDQCWMKENLDIGTMITGSPSNNGTIEKNCYNNVLDSCIKYGGLYQWNEAMQYETTQGAKGICPTGWHIPTIAEFQTLAVAVNNDGNSLKAIGQGTGSGAGTNTSGFSALLAGRRNPTNYRDLEDNTSLWSSTQYSSGWAYYLFLDYIPSIGDPMYNSMSYSFSVRCIKD